jgi:hypothetical protein
VQTHVYRLTPSDQRAYCGLCIASWHFVDRREFNPFAERTISLALTLPIETDQYSEGPTALSDIAGCRPAARLKVDDPVNIEVEA